ncbi:bifunctional phosphoribosyl-AMP cyclohydrolase/phosphoribosyl-ATP diphosphatase HisIE [Nitrospira sp. Kam-Ns4a]
MVDVSRIQFDEQGLLPAVVQDWRDGSVLMLGYMNREALERTLATGRVHFWSRSRSRLWEKGETSGNRLLLRDLFLDCDGDTLLVKAEPVGPTCHTGERACFFTRLGQDGTPEASKTTDAFGGILERIAAIIAERRRSPNPDSYVAKLFAGGEDRILKKVVEEAGEVVLAAKGGKREDIVYEAADLLFHTLLVLGYHGIALEAIYQELAGRFGKSGLRQGGSPEGAQP